MFYQAFTHVREMANSDFTLFGLKMTITIWALVVIALAWMVDNKWLLAGMLAYEVLP